MTTIDPIAYQREAALRHHALRAPAKPAKPKPAAKRQPGPRPILTPKDFLRVRCRQLEVRYEAILGDGRRRGLIELRHQLVREVYAAYPKLGLAAVGRLFSRHPKTIAYALKRRGYETRHVARTTEAQRIEALRLVAEGLSIRAAARATGVSHASVRLWIAADKDGT